LATCFKHNDRAAPRRVLRALHVTPR
jgi:hypothetical protein